MSDDYTATFSEDELTAIYEIASQRPTRDVLDVLGGEEHVALDDFYDQLIERGYEEDDVNYLILTHQGKFLTTTNAESGRYLEPTPLGEAASLSESAEQYVEQVLEADRVVNERESARD